MTKNNQTRANFGINTVGDSASYSAGEDGGVLTTSRKAGGSTYFIKDFFKFASGRLKVAFLSYSPSEFLKVIQRVIWV